MYYTFINFWVFYLTYMALLGTARLFTWIKKSYLHVYLDLHNYDFRLKSVQKLTILNRNFRKLPSEWCNTQGASLQVNFQIQNSKNPINSRSFNTYTFIYFSESLPPARLLWPARLLFLGQSSYLHVYLRTTIIRQLRVYTGLLKTSFLLA